MHYDYDYFILFPGLLFGGRNHKTSIVITIWDKTKIEKHIEK